MDAQNTSTSRRDFLKGAGFAAAGIAALAGASGNAMALPVPTSDITWDKETDVVIAGCGTAGSAAAIAAYDEGADVVILEARDWKGGQLRRCGGGICAANTQVQKALGVEDDVDDFYNFWMATTDGKGDADLIRKYCEGSAGLIDWIIDDLGGQPLSEWHMAGENNGLEYDEGPGLNMGAPYQYDQLGFEPKQRCHWFTKNPDDEILQDPATYLPYSTGGGTGLWKTFSDNLDSRGIEVMTQTPLSRLVTTDGTNEVIGVIAEKDGKDYYIKARKGVVIATGNFATNQDMFANYITADWVAGPGGGLGLDLADENDGSGIKAAMAVGGDLYYPCGFGMNQDAPNGASYVCSGMHVNTDSQVLDVFGEPVPRLFAAGLAAGGVIVDMYPSCGASVGRGLFYGRVAGTTAADLDSWE